MQSDAGDQNPEYTIIA